MLIKLCLIFHQSVFFLVSDGSSEEGMSGLGSPSDPCLSPLAWSVTGKYLASAMEKMVNIWQVNGKLFFFLLRSAGVYKSFSFISSYNIINDGIQWRCLHVYQFKMHYVSQLVLLVCVVHRI